MKISNHKLYARPINAYPGDVRLEITRESLDLEGTLWPRGTVVVPHSFGEDCDLGAIRIVRIRGARASFDF